ncbi:junctophilin-1-like isoform X2 [Adelges cooleyi]|uniref:junctophilin-1-like isoform X2 n=1 Tax=Adelges cooleyi TaxID=133065 RepID=UPI0021805C8D|nr:junctophilin-1-like isoform X2 [Adelges cooleyi]
MQTSAPVPNLGQQSNNSPASTAATGTATTNKILINGGRFDFDDGGTYCGGWEDGKAHGHGVCTGPKGQGAYSGSWHYGFEVSGVYTWPSGNTYEGQWQNGKRHGLGVESRGRWLYRGEWTQGFKGRYGVRQSATTNAKYEGTWANGLQDGYGSETYADGGTFQGQWMRGMRHGYGVRTSAPFGSEDPHKVGSLSEESCLGSEGRDKKLDDTRGGFVLKANSDEQPSRRKTLVSKSTHGLKRTLMSGFKMRKQRSTGELEKKVAGSIRSTASCTSWISTGSSQSAMGESYNTDSNASFIVEDEHMDVNTTETYIGEWKNDKRSGFGVAERTDGLKYEGEWFGNKKYGYGVTTFKDGTKEEGKYKNNVLVTSQKKKHLFLIRSAKFKERIEAAVNASHRASKIALQKADIAISRMATARGKAEQSDIAADHAREDYEIAKLTAKQFAPDFIQPGLEKTRLREILKQRMSMDPALSGAMGAVAPGPPVPAPPEKNSVTFGGDFPSARSSSFDSASKDIASGGPSAESQFKPKSHYAQPYYQSTSSNQIPASSSQSNYSNNKPAYSPRNSLADTSRVHNNSMSASNGGNYNSYNNNNNNNSSSGYRTNDYHGTGKQPAPPPPLSPFSQNGGGGGNQNRPYGGGGGGGSGSSRSGDGRRQSTAHQPSTSGYMHRDESGDGYLNNGFGYDSSRTQYDNGGGSSRPGPSDEPDSSLRRNKNYVNRESLYNFQQAMSDHFDHYKRPPSRDSSVDRYSRAASRLSGESRQSSVERVRRDVDVIPGDGGRPMGGAGGGMMSKQAAGSLGKAVAANSLAHTPPPFEEVILRQRNLGQEIVPSPIGQPKRTESLYVNPNARKDPRLRETPTQTALQRKKSLPDVQAPANAPASITREEVSVLSSARREEIRRMEEENERLRANPLLYLVSPHMKDWFTRQQLVLVILVVNISLALMFFKLLTS